MGAYLCIATNGVPPSVSKRIILDVECEYSITGVGVGVGVWVNSTKWGMKAAPIEGEILGMGTYYIRPVVGCLCQFSWNTRAHLPEREEAIHPTRLSIYLSTHLSIYLSIYPTIPAYRHPSRHRANQAHNHPGYLVFVPYSFMEPRIASWLYLLLINLTARSLLRQWVTNAAKLAPSNAAGYITTDTCIEYTERNISKNIKTNRAWRKRVKMIRFEGTSRRYIKSDKKIFQKFQKTLKYFPIFSIYFVSILWTADLVSCSWA